MKSRLIGKDPDAGKDGKKEEKGMPEDEMVGWHHRLRGPESEQAPGDSGGQRSLACYVHRVAKSQTRLKRLNNKQHRAGRAGGEGDDRV